MRSGGPTSGSPPVSITEHIPSVWSPSAMTVTSNSPASTLRPSPGRQTNPSVDGGGMRAASVRHDPGAQPVGVLGDLELRICTQMTGRVIDLDDAARDIRREPL